MNNENNNLNQESLNNEIQTPINPVVNEPQPTVEPTSVQESVTNNSVTSTPTDSNQTPETNNKPKKSGGIIIAIIIGLIIVGLGVFLVITLLGKGDSPNQKDHKANNKSALNCKTSEMEQHKGVYQDYKGVFEDGYVKGDYFYTYNDDLDGWHAVAYARYTDEQHPIITGELCNIIDGKPLVDTSHMFEGLDVSEVDLSNFNTSNVTDMSNMFSVANGLSGVDLSSFDTSKVTKMNNMFNGTNFEKIDLSNFNTSNVTDMSEMFSGSKLTSLDLSSFDTSRVTDMTRMFFNSSSLSDLKLGTFDTSNVTNMSGIFNDCLSLPDSIKNDSRFSKQ